MPFLQVAAEESKMKKTVSLSKGLSFKRGSRGCFAKVRLREPFRFSSQSSTFDIDDDL
jgi:hypothetical protein